MQDDTIQKLQYSASDPMKNIWNVKKVPSSRNDEF